MDDTRVSIWVSFFYFLRPRSSCAVSIFFFKIFYVTDCIFPWEGEGEECVYLFEHLFSFCFCFRAWLREDGRWEREDEYVRGEERGERGNGRMYCRLEV